MYPFGPPITRSTFLFHVRPRIALAGRRWPSFRLYGVTGFLLAVVEAIILTKHLSLPYLVLAGIVGTTILTFLALAIVTKILVGREQLTYYHHEFSVLVIAVLFLWLSKQPVLSYLDVIILGLGLFLVCGRLGCLSVGCCHGRPWRWGTTYSEEHAREGFPSHLIGVRLFPVQAIESLAGLLIVIAGVAILMRRAAPGSALAWYVVSYGIVRFCLEFMRGDAERPYWLGFSEAQWTSLFLMASIVWAECAKVLPFELWHFQATVGLAAAMIVVVLIRNFRKTPKHQLLHPRHIREVSEAVSLITRFSPKRPNYSGSHSMIHIAHTSLGIRISTGVVERGATRVRHYTLSSEKNPLTTQAARCLAQLILRLRCANGSAEVLQGGQGVFHVLIADGAGDQG
ncbi:MAG: prolipoprotein diacylglyceryl transferase [Terriglobia bacterium]